MRSIRKRLVIWLLLGLAVLWATAGAGLYYAVHRGELARLDGRLDNLSNGLRFYGSMVARELAREMARANNPDLESPPRPERPGGERDGQPGGGPTRNASFFQEDSGEYFVLTSPERPSLERLSPSLKGEKLALPPSIEREPIYYDSEHPDGSRLRTMALRFRPWGRGRSRSAAGDPNRRPPENFTLQGVVAVDAEPMHATLRTLLFGITGVGFLAALASIGLIHFALKDGLKPLGQLGDQLGAIDADSLDGRFSSKSMPTEIAPICDRLNALMGRLETSFERERRFSADLAHELRTPVAELRTMAEVALRWPDGGDAEQSQQTLEIAEQMGGIIESLLTLGRLENGQSETEPEPVDLGELAAGCWKPFAESAAKRHLEIELDLPPGRTLETDPNMLRLIVTNLLSNAADYTPDGGRIEIVARTGKISVANDAPGLDAGKIEHLFERFWRADGSRTDGSHSGLGLSLARACARALGLELAAEHAEGRLVFTLLEKSGESSPASSPDNLAAIE